MISNKARELINSPEYLSLASQRRKMICSLTGINVATYISYVLCMGFARDFMAMRIGDGVINIGLVFTIFLIIFAAVLSGYYMRWTNRYFDPALKKMLIGSGLKGSQV